MATQQEVVFAGDRYKFRWANVRARRERESDSAEARPMAKANEPVQWPNEVDWSRYERAMHYDHSDTGDILKKEIDHLVRMIEREDADVPVVGRHLLKLACAAGNVRAVETLLELGASPLGVPPTRMDCERRGCSFVWTEGELSAPVLAAAHDNADVLSVLLGDKNFTDLANSYEVDDFGSLIRTPLMAVADRFRFLCPEMVGKSSGCSYSEMGTGLVLVEVSSDNACAPFLGQRFEKKWRRKTVLRTVRERDRRRRTSSLLNFRSCSSQKSYPRNFGSRYFVHEICSLAANSQLECLSTSRSSKRGGRPPTKSMTNSSKFLEI